MTAKVNQLYIRQAKGSPAMAVPCAELVEHHGVRGDANAACGEREVSLMTSNVHRQLALVQHAEACLAKYYCNLVLDCERLRVGDRLSFGTAAIEITAVGRACHRVCTLNACPLIEGAAFGRIIRGGEICIGDEAEI